MGWWIRRHGVDTGRPTLGCSTDVVNYRRFYFLTWGRCLVWFVVYKWLTVRDTGVTYLRSLRGSYSSVPSTLLSTEGTQNVTRLLVLLLDFRFTSKDYLTKICRFGCNHKTKVFLILFLKDLLMKQNQMVTVTETPTKRHTFCKIKIERIKKTRSIL